MMVRFRVLAAMMAVVVIASGGRAEQPSPPPEPRSQAATPEAAQHEATETSSAGERALARENERYRKSMAERFDARACEVTRSGPPSAVERSAWGDGGRAGGKEGLVTESYMAGDEHWISVEREPVCRTLCESRRGPCQGIDLEISGSALVLRGSGGGVQPASHSDVAVDQRVLAFHGGTEMGPYYPYGDADKIVILGTR